MDDYKQLSNIIENKSVLYIPIYSCFSYETGKLNFKADGNINRFISTFYECQSYKSLDIFYPYEGNDIDWFENSCHHLLKNINLIKCNYIKKSAKIERSIDFAYDVYEYYKELWDKYDLIIVEAQHLFMRLMPKYKDKLIYWCPVCATNDKTRDFLEPYKELDRYIFSVVRYSILASDDQVDYFMSLQHHGIYIQINTLINRELDIFDYTPNEQIIHQLENNKYKIFLPFRLTDLGYKTQEIIDYLYSIKHKNNFIIYYSNPNSCDIYKFGNGDNNKIEFIKNNFIQVPKDREVYYTIIDECNVIIPYFEDTRFIAHASINEYQYGNCLICKNLEEFKNIFR